MGVEITHVTMSSQCVYMFGRVTALTYTKLQFNSDSCLYFYMSARFT